MAKQSGSYMGGFSGRLGPAVGYQWNGKWCMRARPRVVRNPRSAKQMEHREIFKQEVQQAARMRWVVCKALTGLAREAGMTSYNLFVRLNQDAFSMEEGEFKVDYSRLILSTGTVAPVSVERTDYKSDGILDIKFNKNPLKVRAHDLDNVYLYLYCPETKHEFLTAPVYRYTKKVSLMVPNIMRGKEVEVYLLAENEQGEWSETYYGGCLLLSEDNGSSIEIDNKPHATELVDTTKEEKAIETTASAQAESLAEASGEALATAAKEAPPDSGGVQLGLFDF